jgi:hypothetical protein
VAPAGAVMIEGILYGFSLFVFAIIAYIKWMDGQ